MTYEILGGSEENEREYKHTFSSEELSVNGLRRMRMINKFREEHNLDS